MDHEPPESSIASWEDLCEKFISNFRGTYVRPLNKHDLQAVRQCPGETFRKFIQRFSQVRNKVARITDTQIIAAFSAGVTDVRMRKKLAIDDTLDSAVKLFKIADKCTKIEKADCSPTTSPRRKIGRAHV